MNYESFFREVRESGIELSFDNQHGAAPSRLSNEALFHIPLIAITVLMLSKGRRKPQINQIGQLVGECFERVFSGFKGSSQHVGWSANLRVRTVRAITFLEMAKLIVIEDGRSSATDTGKQVLSRILEDEESDLTFTLFTIERAYRNISTEHQLSLGLA